MVETQLYNVAFHLVGMGLNTKKKQYLLTSIHSIKIIMSTLNIPQSTLQVDFHIPDCCLLWPSEQSCGWYERNGCQALICLPLPQNCCTQQEWSWRPYLLPQGRVWRQYYDSEGHCLTWNLKNGFTWEHIPFPNNPEYRRH